MPLEDHAQPSPASHSPAPPEFPQFQWGGLMLSGPENQDIRLLMRISRVRFTAINESGVPFLTELLKLSKSHPSIRSALLALAGRLRATAYSCTDLVKAGDQIMPRHHASPATVALRKYQEAVVNLREKITQLHSAPTSYDDVLEVLGSVLLLTITGFPMNTLPGQAHDWSFHMAGMISVIQTMDRDVLGSISLGHLVTQMAAHLDIGAFALGRLSKSKRAWLEWGICPPGTPRGADFSAIEVIVGYPKPLLTIIATISAVLEDMNLNSDDTTSLDGLVRNLYEQTVGVRDRPGSSPGNSRRVTLSGDSTADRLGMLEAVLTSSQPPVVPTRISLPVTLALTSAWDIMRKAALLYLWRGGFWSSIMNPIPLQRQQVASKFAYEMVLGFGALLDLAKEQQVSIMNIMTWPLIVVANECGGNPNMQREVISLLQGMEQHFGIEHLKQLVTLLLELWKRFESRSNMLGASGLTDDNLNLNDLSKEFGLCLPLL